MARPAFPPPVQDVVELGRRVSHELLEPRANASPARGRARGRSSPTRVTHCT
jgi:hypothetical protein